MTVKANKSFRVEVAGTRYEVLGGDLLSNSHPVVEAYPDRFDEATEQDHIDANKRARAR